MAVGAYPTDLSMQEFVYDEQLGAKRYMAGVAVRAVRDIAAREHPNDYSMQRHVYDEQLSAKRYMEGVEDRELEAIAVLEHPDDYSMQRHVHDEQLKAKRYMASAKDEEVKAIAVREYASDYSMQKYVYDDQLKAKWYMTAAEASEAKDFVVREYPQDYSMQRYAYDVQSESRRQPKEPPRSRTRAGSARQATSEGAEAGSERRPAARAPAMAFEDVDSDETGAGSSASPVGEDARRAIEDPAPVWIRTLFDSEVYAAQSRAAGLRAPTCAQMKALLRALDGRGDRLPETMLARALGIPAYRVRGLIAAARTVLNVDGVEILSVDDATAAKERTVRLDRGLLARQFRLDAEGSAAV